MCIHLVFQKKKKIIIIIHLYCTINRKISSNYMCGFIVIKRALDIYHSRAIKSSCSFLIFTDSGSALQEILRDSSQVTQEIISFSNRIVATQRACTQQWIPAHVDIFNNEQYNLVKEAQNSPQLCNSQTFADDVSVAICKLTCQPTKNSGMFADASEIF